jgi:hypothetical protein
MTDRYIRFLDHAISGDSPAAAEAPAAEGPPPAAATAAPAADAAEGAPTSAPSSRPAGFDPGTVDAKLRDQVDRAVRVHRASFHQHHRARTLAALEANREALAAATARDRRAAAEWPTAALPDTTTLRAKDAPPAEGWPAPPRDGVPPAPHPAAAARLRPAPAAPLAPAPRPASNYVDSKYVGLQAWALPAHAAVPQYKAWCHVTENQLSLEVDQRMFYTDPSTGETVPVSDDEEEEGRRRDPHAEVRAEGGGEEEAQGERERGGVGVQRTTSLLLSANPSQPPPWCVAWSLCRATPRRWRACAGSATTSSSAASPPRWGRPQRWCRIWRTG